MILNTVKLSPFGGINGREVQFKPGLNVVVGPNEAGKSTMVNALFAVLFLPTNLALNSKLWKNNLARFLPYGGGDTMLVTVDFQDDAGHTYSLSRSWGATKSCRLTMADGNVITSETKAQEIMAEILQYGRGTYEGVLFARQEEMMQTIELLRQNNEAAATLGDILRTALLQGGGVSLEEFAIELSQKKKALLSNWDLERDAPKNNRSVDNPYVQNVGDLLKAFYAKERLRRRLQASTAAEKQVETALIILEQAAAAKAELAPRKAVLEALESDVIKRSSVTPELKTLALQEEKLKVINREWPQETERKNNLQKSIAAAKVRLTNLAAELEAAKAAVAAKKLRERYLTAKPIQEELTEMQHKLTAVPQVTAADVQELEQQQNKLTNKETEVQAMKLLAELSLAKPQTITVTSALAEPQVVEVAGEAAFSGAGSLLFATEEWTLKVQAGQCDVEALMEEITTVKAQMQEKLRQLSLTDLSAVRQNLESRQMLAEQISRLQAKLEGVLQEQAFAEIAAAVEEITEIMTREPEMVLTELLQVQADLKHAEAQVQAILQRLTAWEQEYGNYDAVMDKVVDIRTEVRQLQTELTYLAPLPEEYADTDSFLSALKSLREQSQQLETQLAAAKEQLLGAQQEQGTDTADDLQARYQEAEQHFQRIKREAAALLKVEVKFNHLSTQLNQNTFAPFAAAFCRYLAPATGYRYQTAALAGTLPCQLEAADGKTLPVELLSTGTTRGIALALRLAMAEFLLQQSGGFLVMDDPLVDLDPARQKHAASMIRDYAQTRQVIITTCDPDTANRLGGNVIDWNK
ncbi:MAG TPA: AAA family ATPase [Oscillospiraceae bacterium]|nr:AAA family ATPase [Oscillospiraceae bacterium]